MDDLAQVRGRVKGLAQRPNHDVADVQAPVLRDLVVDLAENEVRAVRVGGGVLRRVGRQDAIAPPDSMCGIQNPSFARSSSPIASR